MSAAAETLTQHRNMTVKDSSIQSEVWEAQGTQSRPPPWAVRLNSGSGFRACIPSEMCVFASVVQLQSSYFLFITVKTCSSFILLSNFSVKTFQRQSSY